MQNRKWDSKTKLQIVLMGIKGKSVAEICNQYQIGQGQYYRWRDEFLQNGHKSFELEKTSQQEHRLLRENQRLKNLVGELNLELKKNEEFEF